MSEEEEDRVVFEKSGMWLNLSRSGNAVNLKLGDGRILTASVTSVRALIDKERDNGGVQFSVFTPHTEEHR